MTNGHFWSIFQKCITHLAGYEENFQELFTNCCVTLDREKQMRTLNKIMSI